MDTLMTAEVKSKRREPPTPPRAPAPALPFDPTSTQGRLLLAASAVLAERGVADVTVEEVLQVARVARRTFYKHFASRDDLLVTLHRTLSEGFVAATKAASRAGSVDEHVARTVDVFLTVAQRGGALFRVLQGEALRPGSPLAPRRQELFILLAELHGRAAAGARGEAPDPLIVHGALAGVEAILHRVVLEGPLEGARLDRARAAMIGLLSSALSAPPRRGSA
jgi:AcrR family transcriptional regulator